MAVNPPPQASTAPGVDSPRHAHTTVIEPRRGWLMPDWREMLEYRELLYFLIWRDVKVRYKQTVLGVAWAVLQPVVTMVLFTVIFGHFVGISSEGYAYPIFVYAGLLPWIFFSSSVALAGQSLINQQHLLTKIYFPRLFVPTAAVGAGLIDLAISFGVYCVILLGYAIWGSAAQDANPGAGLLMLPLLVALTVAAALGLSWLLAALTVRYRDFRYVIPFMLQAMMYISPIIYPVSIVPPAWRWVLALNPMAGIIDGYRSAILGKPWDWLSLSISAAVTVGLLVLGLMYFRRTERRFADIA